MDEYLVLVGSKCYLGSVDASPAHDEVDIRGAGPADEGLGAVHNILAGSRCFLHTRNSNRSPTNRTHYSYCES
jgi:hypothetical protein